MENKAIDKLVIVSRNDYGKELSLLSERTTIGSAPDNDIQLQDKEIAGFHAQLQLGKDVSVLMDFDTETGTFLNGEKVKQEIPIAAGDMIQIGSTQAVFLPSNSIVAKESLAKGDLTERQELFKGISPKLKKVIAGCLVVLLLVLVKAALIPGTKPKESNQKAETQPGDTVSATLPAGNEHGTTGEENAASEMHATESNPSQLPDKTTENKTDQQAMEGVGDKKISSQSAAEIYFNTGRQFADYRLWSPALENYYKVADLKSDYPDLFAEIERMQFEMKNQAVFEAGVGLIRSMQYEKGIARLNTIAEESVYFDDAAQKIAAAKKEITTEREEIAKAENKYPVKRSLKSATKKITKHPDVIKHALIDYTEGSIQTALEKLERALQTVGFKNGEGASQAKEIKKQIKYAEFLYRKGDKQYSSGQALAAISTWSQFFEADHKLAPEKNSFFYLSVVQKMAKEYSQRANKAYSSGDFRTAYLLSEKALKIKVDDPQSLVIKKKLVKKSKQLYEEGYILEEYNYEKALEKYKQIFKICDEDTVYYQKALARVGRK